MQELMNKRRNQKGFTLAELLIVVAIIAVLVAIAIPIFTTQLEKSREATDKANIRSAYAEASAELLDNESSAYKKEVTAKQTVGNWQSNGGDETTEIGGMNVKASTSGWTIAVSGGAVTITAK